MGVHFVGGVVGVLLIRLLATAAMTGRRACSSAEVWPNWAGNSSPVVAVAVYAFAVSFVLAKLIDRTMGFRVSAEDETSGIDLSQHAETAYAEGGVHGHAPGRRPDRPARSARSAIATPTTSSWDHFPICSAVLRHPLEQRRNHR